MNSFAFANGAQSGMNSFSKRLIGAAGVRQKAQDDGIKELAAADKAHGEAEAKRAQAARMDAGGAALADEPAFISSNAGIALPLAQKASQFYRTGNWGTVQPLTPNDDEGNVNPVITLDRATDAPAGLDMGLVNRARQLRMATLTGKESTADQIAKAAGEFQGQGITDNVQNDISQGLMDRASARNQGGKLGTQIKVFDPVGATGATIAPASGAVDVSSPLAQATLGKTAAETAHANAQAREAEFKAQGGGTDKSPNLHPIYDADGNALAFNPKTGQTAPIIGPDGNPVLKRNTEKAMPASAVKGLQENQASLRQAQKAFALINGENVGAMHGSTDATGFLAGITPDSILQRNVPFLGDPAGVDTRAAIADIGSLKIHDRSGAAVTASEFPRLKPFVPLVSDDPATVKKKLSAFIQEYQNIVAETQDFYRESGYKVPDVLRNADGSKGDAAPPASAAAPKPAPNNKAPAAVAEGTTMKSASGKDMVYKNGKWIYVQGAL